MKQTLQYLFVNLLIDRLALWQALTVDNAEILRRLLHGARFEGVEGHQEGCNDGDEVHPRRILPAVHRGVAEKAGLVH